MYGTSKVRRLRIRQWVGMFNGRFENPEEVTIQSSQTRVRSMNKAS